MRSRYYVYDTTGELMGVFNTFEQASNFKYGRGALHWRIRTIVS